MRSLALAVAAAVFVLVAPVAAWAQSLTVVGPDGTETVLDAARLATLPRAEARLGSGDKAKTYEGPTLTAVLREAGVATGPKLHGKPLVAYVVVTGADGYRAVLSIAETDAWIAGDGAVILADKRTDGPLELKEGTLRLVVGSDRRPERSVRMVTRVEVRPLD